MDRGTRPTSLRASPPAPQQPPPLSSGKGGSHQVRGPRPAGTGGTAQRGPTGGQDATIAEGRVLGDTRWRTHLSPAAAQPLRRGSTPAHRHAELVPAPYLLTGGSNGGSAGGSDAFSESGPTAPAARPPRPLPPAPAHSPLPPAGRKYRLFQPQTGTDVGRPREWPQKTSDRKRRDKEEADYSSAPAYLRRRPSR